MKYWRHVLFAALALAAFPGPAAAADNDAIRDAFLKLDKKYSLLQERLNNSTTALEKICSLMPGRDLKGPLADFSRNLDKFDGLNQGAAKDAADFNDRLAARYDDWRTQIGQIHSSAIRDLAAKRLADQQAQFQLLDKDIAATQEKIGPLIGQMRDIETYLKADLTGSSVAALGEPLQQASTLAKEAQRSMATLKGAFAQSREAISSTPQ